MIVSNCNMFKIDILICKINPEIDSAILGFQILLLPILTLAWGRRTINNNVKSIILLDSDNKYFHY